MCLRAMTLADMDRDAMIDAMRVAAEKRVEGILRNSRRRHYGHAAMLVGLVRGDRADRPREGCLRLVGGACVKRTSDVTRSERN